VRPIAQPLRLIARRWSRTLAAAQMISAVEAGARVVSLGSLLGPEFDAAPDVYFGPDKFHPSADGYAACASALLPSVCEVVGLWPTEAADALMPSTTAPVLPVAVAAAEAAEEPGTEVTAAVVGGQDRGPRGRWARLRRRRIPAGTVDLHATT
jgi:hypothetical protein